MKFKRRFYRKFKYNRKRSFLFIFLFLLCLSFGLGYSLISTDLNIFGTTVLKDNRWSVYFDNIQEIEGSVSPTIEPEITNDTTVSFSAKLKNPGDKYEFLIDVVNDGTIDAKIGNISMSPTLTEEQQNFFSYEVTYESGVTLSENQALDAGSTETLKVSFKYLEQEDNSLYPDTDQTFNVVLTGEYVQGTGTPVVHPYLYNVLMNEAESGGLAKKYTGEHHDSFTEEPTKDIYHWYASNDSQGTQVLNKNNVIFANHCWQMIRTTDTGGVKMIYNGEVENNQCLDTRSNHVGYSSATTQNMSTTYYYGTSYNYDKTNNVFSLAGVITTGTIQPGQYTCKETTSNGTCATLYLVDTLNNGTSYYVIPLNGNSHYSQFGSVQFNQIKNTTNSPSYLGYMYNTIYAKQDKGLLTDNVYDLSNLSTNYYFADSYDYNQTTPNKYTLINPYQVSSTSDYSSLIGKYTFGNVLNTYSNDKILYIAGVSSGNNMYFIELSGGHNLQYYNNTYTYGESYTDNGNGTYTINNPTTINRTDYFSSFTNIKNKYICKNAINNTCTDLWHSNNGTDGRKIYYSSSSNKYVFSSGFEYNSSTNKYELSSDKITLWDTLESSFITNVNTHHYTCFSTTDECSAISYVYFYSDNIHYINIENGKNATDAINEMLYNDDVNATNSTMKTGIDAWYEKKLMDYSNYLEDIVFCNNRVQSNSNTNGWKPNGGSVSSNMAFSIQNSFLCQNETDQFSTLNNKARLKYKVGLVSANEMNIMGNNNTRKTQETYWTLSPGDFYYSNACEMIIQANGNIYYYGNVSAQSNGVRPAVSLKPKTVYSSGDGSMESPYIIN